VDQASRQGLPGRLRRAPGKRSGDATRIVCHPDALCSFLRAQSIADDVVLDEQSEGFGSSVPRPAAGNVA
jgi:hypothetical protein